MTLTKRDLVIRISEEIMERLPGFRDFYPEPLPHTDVWSADARRHIFDAGAVARRYGFREYDGPPLEPLELYTLKSGEEIVGQLYNFVDKGERPVALRPEMTPTLARMVAAHERITKSRSSGSPSPSFSATNASKRAACANISSSTPISSANRPGGRRRIDRPAHRHVAVFGLTRMILSSA
jgi:hypothetical protein